MTPLACVCDASQLTARLYEHFKEQSEFVFHSNNIYLRNEIYPIFFIYGIIIIFAEILSHNGTFEKKVIPGAC